MYAALKIFGGGNPGAVRWRRFSAMVGTAAVIGAGTVLAASPAHADTYTQSCSAYHSWTECISFDYTDQVIAVNAHNGYSTEETEALWISVGANVVATKGFDIPAGSGAGFGIATPDIPSNTVCGGIDNVRIACANFPANG